jgi:hypothetical protein
VVKLLTSALQRVTPSRNYLIAVGAIANIVALTALLAIPLYFDRPIAEVINKVDDRLSKSNQPVAKTLHHLLGRLDMDPKIEKMSTPPRVSHTLKPLNSAANPDNYYPYQTYDPDGRPHKLPAGHFRPSITSRRVHVDTQDAIARAIKNAKPGQIITIAPGNYRFSGRAISVTRPGTATEPIYVRAERLGSVTLSMNTLEGFHVKAPYWIFENLNIVGACESDQHCEHAFHVVGKGSSFVLRNSIVRDFNASLKVNGLIISGTRAWPDYGLIEHNVFQNSSARETGNTVALLNIDSVDHWVVRGNYITDFAKARGNKVSYGAYMKGNGKSGIFERNVVICENKLPVDGGIRLGLSFGGGGTENKYCRGQSCATEHRGGVMRNNIISNCSEDVGIYLNKSADTRIYNNLLLNNLGIDIRYASSSAVITNNLISGRIKQRDGGIEKSNNNYIDRACFGHNRSDCFFDELYADPDNIDLRLLLVENPIWSAGLPVNDLTEDLCGMPRGQDIDLGPIQYSNGLDCLQSQNPNLR